MFMFLVFWRDAYFSLISILYVVLELQTYRKFCFLQLALAELYEDEAKRQSLCSDKPTATRISNPKMSQTLKLDSLKRLRKPERSMSDDKENQRFYSGDSEYRGLQISGASNNPSKIVAELFKEAKEHGAVPLDEASRASGDFSKAKSFSGGGYRLGDSSQKHSEYIYEENQDVQVLLKLWRNGFSLDDGELRSYSDPTNAQFLESVKRGEIPLELQRLVHGGQVNLDMEDHQEQEYVKPRLRFKAFSGEGQKLGSLTPEIVSTPSSPEEEEKSILNAPVLIDDSMPATKIQIRLADGSRLIQRFNQTHRQKTLKPHKPSSGKAALQFTEQEQADMLQPEDAAVKHFCCCETCERDLRKVEQYERKA
uniref:UBX domain-containing protein 2B n=1 Tax=Ficedula albicollis TaxID=59894 RepID=A0A803WDB9_FICAL